MSQAEDVILVFSLFITQIKSHGFFSFLLKKKRIMFPFMHPKILPHAPSATISKKWKTSGEKLIHLVRGVQTKLTWTSTNILNAKTFSLHRHALHVIDSFEWRDLSSEECISRVRSKGNIRNYRNVSCICQHHQEQRLLIHIRGQLHGRAGKHGLGKNLLSTWNQCSSL